MSAKRLAVHVHSSWSYDGSWSLEQIARRFARHGYDGVLLAEHDRGFDDDRWEQYRSACAAASTPTTLLVPGLEYSDPTNSVHVPVWGVRAFLGEGRETTELLSDVAQAGGVAVLAHPARRRTTERIDPRWLASLTGIELWNRKYDGYAPSLVAVELLNARPELVPFVSLDLHSARQLHPLAMICELPGPLTAEDVYEAMLSGRVRPTAFGVPALRFAGGVAWPAIRGLERVRKCAAAQVRRAPRLGRDRP